MAVASPKVYLNYLDDGYNSTSKMPNAFGGVKGGRETQPMENLNDLSNISKNTNVSKKLKKWRKKRRERLDNSARRLDASIQKEDPYL